MAVTHYKGLPCNTKAKTIKDTDDKALVTCKRCLKKLASSVSNKVQAEIFDNLVVLSFKRLQLKFKRNEGNDLFMFCAPEGFVFTSPALTGTQIKRSMDEKDRVYFKDLFASLKQDGVLTGESIYNHFKG